MFIRRPAWLFALSVGGFVVALSGCGGHPNVGAVRDGLTAAEPAPSADADKPADHDAPAFHFPDDSGGALLAKVLPPTDVKSPLNEPAAEPRRPTGLDAPPPSLPLPPAPPPAPPAPGEHARKPLAPRLVVEETLSVGCGDPQPPAPRSFYVGDRVRLPSVDVNQPIPPPILAQPSPDRASLDDPTVDASAEAALAAPMPQRTKAAPYVRITLPDPFDNRRPLSLPVPPDGDNLRTGTVRLPKP